MRVTEFMTQDVVSIAPEASLADATVALADNHVSGLAVINQHHRLIGVISVTDVVAAQAETEGVDARGRVLRDTLVRDVMSTRPLVIGPETSMREAAQQMEYAGVHRVFVVLDGKPIGVVSRSDVNRGHALGTL
jgi:CBS domain-containing protein